MTRRYRFVAWLCCPMVLWAIAAPATAGAQAGPMVRVVRPAAVLQQPAGDAPSVGTVVAGELLDVLDERDGWFLVRPPAGGPAREWRTGWVNAQTVESVNRPPAGAAAPDATLAAAPPELTARRKGFLIGLGGGVGLHRTPGFTVYDRFGRITAVVEGTNNVSVVTNFTIGYAPSDRVMLYYSNRAAFTSDENYDALGVTGFGASYMFRATSPTMYLTGSIGGGFGASLYQDSTAEAGLGWTAGAGWEFKRHLSLEGDVLVVQLGDRGNQTVYRGLFHYTFY